MERFSKMRRFVESRGRGSEGFDQKSDPNRVLNPEPEPRKKKENPADEEAREKMKGLLEENRRVLNQFAGGRAKYVLGRWILLQSEK